MPTLIVIMIVTASAVTYWNSTRAAAERAEAVGRDACRTAGVQWLDDSVHETGVRLRRQEGGRLCWERTFRFDYSLDGNDRHTGRIVLQGERLVAFSGPVTRPPVPLR